MICPACHGDGEVPFNPGYPDPQTLTSVRCSRCGGEGVVATLCRRCGGRGSVPAGEDTCTRCDGSGREDHDVPQALAT